MNINYTVLGNGDENLLLLHGWGGSIKSLSGLQKELSKNTKYKIYNLELPGFGESNKLKNPLKYEDYVNFVYEFIKQKKINNLTLIGHSFGGKVSLGFALKHSEYLEKLILVNSSGLKPKNKIKKAVFYVPTKIFGAVFSLPVLKVFKDKVRGIYYKFVVRERDYLNSEKMRITLKNVLDVNFSDQLNNIKTETLLIWGEKDTYTPVWMAYELSKYIRSSRLEIVKEGKHNLPVVSPETVSKLIQLFIN